MTQDNVIVLLRSNKEHTKYQLEILITTPFKTPDIGVYLSNEQEFNKLKSHYLGNLSSKGGELFDLPITVFEEGIAELVLFDPIKNELLNQISIKL